MVGATGISIDHGVGPQTGTSAQVSPTATTTYKLTATGPTGQSTALATVAVAPQITAFTASPDPVDPGDTTTLSWTVSGPVTGLSLDQGIGDVTGQASAPTPPLGLPTVFTLTASNGTATHTRTVTAHTRVTVAVFPFLPSQVLLPGDTLQLTAQVQGTTDTRVTWRVNPSGYDEGTVTDGGLFTAGWISETTVVTATSVASPSVSATSTIQVHRPDAGELDTSFGDGGYYFGEVGTAAGEAWVNPNGDDIYLPETLTVADGGTFMRLRHLLPNGTDDPNYVPTIGAPGAQASKVLPGGRWIFGVSSLTTTIEPRTPFGMYEGRHGEIGYQINNPAGGGSCVYSYDDLGTTHLVFSGEADQVVDGGTTYCVGGVVDYSSSDSFDSFSLTSSTCIDPTLSTVASCVQSPQGMIYGLSQKAGSNYDFAVSIQQTIYDFSPDRLKPNNVTLVGSDLIFSGSLFSLTNLHQACATTVNLSGARSSLFGGGVCPQMQTMTNVVLAHSNTYYVAGKRSVGTFNPLSPTVVRILANGDYSSSWVAPISSSSIGFANLATQSTQRILIIGTDSQNHQSFIYRIWP